MNDQHTGATETTQAEATSRDDIGAKALALAGFAEAALVEDPITTGHGGILTWPWTGHEG